MPVVADHAACGLVPTNSALSHTRMCDIMKCNQGRFAFTCVPLLQSTGFGQDQGRYGQRSIQAPSVSDFEGREEGFRAASFQCAPLWRAAWLRLASKSGVCKEP